VVDGRSLTHWLLADTDEANAAVRKMVVLEKVFIFLFLESECSESMFVSWYFAVSLSRSSFASIEYSVL
jgi:hypothetical protein